MRELAGGLQTTAGSTATDATADQTGASVAARAADAPEVAAPPTGAAGECPNCGAPLAGDYCHACGEKRPEARDLSVRHFLRDAAQELTSLDSKLFRTL
ncbi:MAG TPA: hypothetical protein VNZ44_05130, partial [Pyrinomonadaceae bacterium]|nr:hypothetical protein [Pyrinomonadaceae bacterium]